MLLNTFNFVLLLCGTVVGGLIAWVILKSRLALAEANGRAAGDVERTQLAEQLKAAIQDAGQAKQRAATFEATTDELRTVLEGVKSERTQFEVRALRIPEMEDSVRQLRASAESLNQQIGDFREQNGRLLAEVTAHQRQISELDQARAHLISEREAMILEHESRITKLRTDTDLLNQQIGDFREQNGRLTTDVAARQRQINELDQARVLITNERDALNRDLSTSQSTIATLTQELKAERVQGTAKLAILEQAKQTLSDQFRILAGEILDEKSRKFTEQNQTNLGQLLNPLREKMNEFRAKVEEIHIKDTEQQATLKAELGQIKDLNRQMTAEAHNLATALKGDAKKRGNWGELILGNVLERSGLSEGKDFRKEVSFATDEGRKRPDIIVYLPQNKHLVIDAKVSLNAYTRYVNAEDELTRQQALNEHVAAVASRIQELSDRNYFEVPGINSPEMVFMFIPIESAFVEALRADESLFQKAIERNVLVATPTTLLTSLNIVRQLWRFEEQNAHTAELAESAAAIYKKLGTFLTSMTDVGEKLDKARDSFGRAMGQLYSGKGNLIQRAKDFERLGVSVKTSLPDQLVAKATLELEHLPDAPESEADSEDAAFVEITSGSNGA